jgi:uncharacterized protein (TIGR03067 family)
VRHCIACAAFLALAVPVSRAADDDAAKAAKKIEGTYAVVEATRGGKPEEKAKDVESFVIKDGKITIKVKNKDRDMVAKFTLDPSKKPTEIDIMPEDANETLPGIYQTKDTKEGLELTLAFGGGPNPERPKDFKGEGENEIALKLRKK